jgi:hypothetical protein
MLTSMQYQYQNISTIKRNAKAVLGDSKEVCLYVNAEKMKCMSFHQNAGQNHNVIITGKSFRNVTEFKHLGTSTNQNFIFEIKRMLNLGNACSHSVETLLSFHLHWKNLQIKIHKTIISPILHGCENWSLTPREGHILKMQDL